MKLEGYLEDPQLRRLAARATGTTGKPGVLATPSIPQQLLGAVFSALGAIRPGGVTLPSRPMPFIDTHAPHSGPFAAEPPMPSSGFSELNPRTRLRIESRFENDATRGGRPRTYGVAPERRVRMLEMYNANPDDPRTLANIAMEYQISRDAVRHILRQEGVYRTPEVDLNQFLYLRTSGLSPEEAASRMNVRLQDINRVIATRARSRTRGPDDTGRASNLGQLQNTLARIDAERDRLTNLSNTLMRKPQSQWTDEDYTMANNIVNGLSRVDAAYTQLENITALSSGQHSVISNPFIDRQISGNRHPLSVETNAAFLTGGRATGDIYGYSRFNNPNREMPPTNVGSGENIDTSAILRQLELTSPGR